MTVASMSDLANSLITLANGGYNLLVSLANPLVWVSLAMAAGFGWLALVEVDEVNRQGAKPVVGRH